MHTRQHCERKMQLAQSENEAIKPVNVFTKPSVSKKTRKRATVSLGRPRCAALLKRAVVVAFAER